MNPETKPVSFPADGHPDENQLLLALERELLPEESAEVEQHLGKCWNCRARSEEIQRGILAFVEYRDKRYLPSLKPPPNEYSGFQGQLRAIVGERTRTGLLARIRHRLFPSLALPRHMRWVSAVAAVMALVLLWTEVLHPPVVSANELLTRAMISQNPSPSGETAMPVRIARQKLQIRSGQQTVERDFEWVVGRPIRQAKWDEQSDPLHWAAPLTAEGFAEWRGSLNEKNDKVNHSGDFFTIKTITTHAFIQEASMVVRAKDFHPVEQHLRFADYRQLDLKEITFEILDQPRGKQQLAAPLGTAQTSPPQPPQEKPVASAQNLDETEMQLRYTLFTHQWDLGEDLSIERGPDRVIVSGTVSSRERAEAMRVALAGLPNVQLLFNAPRAVLNGTPRSHQAPTAEAQTRSSDPLLKTELSEAFPSREDRQSFVDRCLAVSDAALSHAWALKRLADRYTLAVEQRLGPESQAKLRNMLRVHLEEVRRANGELQPLLEMLPSSPGGELSARPDWRANILSLFEQLQEQDKLVAALVVGTRTNGLEPGAAAGKFRANHKNIEVTVRGSLRDLAGDGRQ